MAISAVASVGGLGEEVEGAEEGETHAHLLVAEARVHVELVLLGEVVVAVDLHGT